MNIKVQVCGLVLVTIIELLYRGQGKNVLGSQRQFARMLHTSFLLLILDIFTLVLINRFEGRYNIVIYEICKLYLVSLVTMCYSSCAYIVEEISNSSTSLKRFITATNILRIICSIFIMIVPIHIHNGENSYTYGPSINMAYVICGYIITVNFYILFRYKRKIDKRRWGASLIWMMAWIVSAVIQFINNELLVVGFAAALGSSVLYMKMENPESYHDRDTGLLNDYSFKLYVKELEKKQINCRILVVVFNILDLGLSSEQEQDITRNFANYLQNSEGIVTFRCQNREFIIVSQDEQKLVNLSNLILWKIKEPWEIQGKSYYTDCYLFEIDSTHLDNHNDLDIIPVFVTEKMEEAKGNLVYMDSDWISRHRRKIEIEKLISEAIDDNRILVYYQPIYSVEKKRYTSAEALVRIIDKEDKIIPPGEFIPIAEDNESIITLGEIVFRKTCQMIVRERLFEKGYEYIEINLSVVQSTKADFADKIISIIKQTGVDPKMINLEITETAAIRSKEVLLKNMRKLIDYGITFSLDDFGTGYSNLNYIMELPVDIVKFDKNMTDSYFESDRNKMVMSTAINMIKAMGMKIVVEGVERKEQLEAVCEEGVHYIQGFYFSRPLPEKDFVAGAINSNVASTGV